MSNSSTGRNGNGGGPCGACKFLRRKCVKGCVFAPYFDSEQGTEHFAAVHKVFGASNASKLLLRIPPHKRLDAVVTLCYEALARLRDPVYGCVAHIFALQQQVVNLQAELAYVQAGLSTAQPPASLLQPPPQPQIHTTSSWDMASTSSSSNPSLMLRFDPLHLDQISPAVLDIDHLDFINGGNLQLLAREFVSRYLPGARFGSPTA
ncbi:LOB domain-containing protein 19 [Malania oleifera]|uniref:LOB domain-containing protein 19 n=1 Tax=Malania oleifera TaxID=397392 RepID=UPI0025AECAA2|nr:LOB domain-containing protein 19 [Malania oleifera]